MTALTVVHGLHVLAGVAWGGGQLLFAFGLWPALLRLPAPEARRFLARMAGPVGLWMMLSGASVLLLGVLRATWLGPISSWEAAFGTSYGRACLVALALTIGLSVHGARTDALVAQLFEGEQWHPRARMRVYASSALEVMALIGVLVCMIRLRFGL